jgi:hypothetical protein
MARPNGWPYSVVSTTGTSLWPLKSGAFDGALYTVNTVCVDIECSRARPLPQPHS